MMKVKLLDVRKNAKFFINEVQFIKISNLRVSPPFWNCPPNAVIQSGERAGRKVCINSNKEVYVNDKSDLI